MIRAFARRALTLTFGVWVAMCAALFVFQSTLVFVPSAVMSRTPADAGLDFEPVTLTTRDGERLLAWWVPPPSPDGAVVLFAHGNAGNLSHRLDTLRAHHRMGHGVLAFDYRGYGVSTGTPSEAGLALDARAAWDHLTIDRGIPAARIVLHGRSLGAGVAVGLATEVEAAGLVVEAAFTSLPDLAAELYPLFPVRWLSRIEFPNRRRLAALNLPVLVVHGVDDTLVPFTHGRALHAITPNATLLALAGGHNDAFVVSAGDYQRGVGEFVARAVKSVNGS